MEVYFFKQTTLLFAIKLILCSLFTFLICKLHPPVPWLLTIGKTAHFCFQFEYALPYLDGHNLSPVISLPPLAPRGKRGKRGKRKARQHAVHDQHLHSPATRPACVPRSRGPFIFSFFFFLSSLSWVWEGAQLQQGGLEILGLVPRSQKVLAGRTSDTQRNKDKHLGGWRWLIAHEKWATLLLGSVAQKGRGRKRQRRHQEWGG